MTERRLRSMLREVLMIRRMIAVAAMGWLTLASASAAPTPAVLPLASPPPASNPTASSIFDAMMAISRAVGTNPSAAQNASFPYAAAVQQYNAGDYDAARRSAIDAIAKSNAPNQPQPTNPPPNVSPQPPAYLPPVTSVSQAEMEERLALARRALNTCGPTTGAPFAAARSVYDTAVQNELAQHADALNANVQSIVDGCAGAVAQIQPQPQTPAAPGATGTH